MVRIKPGYQGVKKILTPIIKAFCSIKVEGEENLPEGGGFIIASNHLTFLDPLVLSVWFLTQISFGAKTELFKFPGLRALLEWTEQIPLKRDGMTRDELNELVSVAQSRMDRGVIFGLFPEGTRPRDGKLLDFQSGVILIATRTNRPIVPIGIAYERRGVRLYVRIRIGKPLQSGNRRMRDFKRELELRVAELSGQERAHRRRLKKENFPKAA